MQDNLSINRKHKDRLFRFIFNNEEALLSLYNAINDSDYTNPGDLQIYTMENFLYMGMKNDLSFIIDMNLNIYEHQSTFNPNMPIRGFMYTSAALQKYVAVNNFDLYSSKQIPIPIPRYYVFYNGLEDCADEQILKLTDNMLGDNSEEESSAQFVAHMININAGKNSKIMQRCPRLYEYSVFINEVRMRHTSGLDYTIAVDQAVDYCVHNNILSDILLAHKAEVTHMLLEEYNEQFHIANEKAISQEEGREMERENTRREKERADAAELHVSILQMTLKGNSADEIASKLNIPIETVKEFLENN